jgi:N-acetylneuraminate synthase
MYPTPYNKVRLGSLKDLNSNFPKAILGLSDHSLGIYTCLGAVALGASVLEKHFTSSMKWKGPDIPISITPKELKDLILGSSAIWEASGGRKGILKEEKPTIDFAYACVVSTKLIKKGEKITMKNVWVKRPGTGEIKAVDYSKIIDMIATVDINKDVQIKWKYLK